MGKRTRTTWQGGEGHPKARLTEEQVRSIVRCLARGWTQQALADEYDISRVSVSNINTGMTWRHVTGKRRPVRPD